MNKEKNMPDNEVQYGGRKANKMPVVYNRQQTPHSLTKHLLFGWLVLYIPTLYYKFSPNHFFKL